MGSDGVIYLHLEGMLDGSLQLGRLQILRLGQFCQVGGDECPNRLQYISLFDDDIAVERLGLLGIFSPDLQGRAALFRI